MRGYEGGRCHILVIVVYCSVLYPKPYKLANLYDRTVYITYRHHYGKETVTKSLDHD